nr:transposase family protein [Allomuricauda sp.]
MEHYVKLVDGKYYLSDSYLVKSGVNQRTLNNYISKANKGKSTNFRSFKERSTKKSWILFETIPPKILAKHRIQVNEDNLDYHIEKVNKTRLTKRYKAIWFVLFNAWSEPSLWMQYMPYYANLIIDKEKQRLLSKTHAIFKEIFGLQKEYALKEIHSMYLKLANAAFWTDNYNSFNKKILKAKREGISEVLVHDFILFGRQNYKLSLFAQRRIKYHYSISKAYSIQKIHSKVNEELLERGLSTLSYSTVQKFLNRPAVRNQCDIIRYGDAHAKQHLFPYIMRKEPDYQGQILQIDATILNLHCLDHNKKPIRLRLCVVIDVYSRKIIGHSLAESENSVMVLSAIRDAFENFGIIPIEIVYDGAKAFKSRDFQLFKEQAEEYGINFRTSRARNPRDKGHVERWFRTFQSSYMCEAYGSYGAGIKSTRLGERAQQELVELYQKKENLRDIDSTKKLIANLIGRYNSDTEVKYKDRINQKDPRIKKFKPSDTAKFFYDIKTIKVTSSMVVIRVDKIKYSFTIKNDRLAQEINRTKVLVRYNKNELSKIFIYEENTGRFLAKLDQDYKINLIPTEKDLVHIKERSKLVRDRIKNQISGLVEELDRGKIELNEIPIQVHNPPKLLQRVLGQAEDELLIADMLTNAEKHTKGSKKAKDKAHRKDSSDIFFKRKRKNEVEIIV